MSCNGCRVLRKGCSESCILRPCLQWIGSPESQANATVFVAKFFGRAGLMSFISSVPESQRPALFQSLLFEACGRTVNPVNGAVGLLWTGNWQVCQQAVETVLRGGVLRPMAEIPPPNLVNGGHDCAQSPCFRAKAAERKAQPLATTPQTSDLDLCLSSGFRITASAQRRPETPSVNSDEGSVTTCSASGRDWAIPTDRSGSNGGGGGGGERRLLDLFV